jgi:hypothetical protein
MAGSPTASSRPGLVICPTPLPPVIFIFVLFALLRVTTEPL